MVREEAVDSLVPGLSANAQNDTFFVFAESLGARLSCWYNHIVSMVQCRYAPLQCCTMCNTHNLILKDMMSHRSQTHCQVRFSVVCISLNHLPTNDAHNIMRHGLILNK